MTRLTRSGCLATHWEHQGTRKLGPVADPHHFPGRERPINHGSAAATDPLWINGRERASEPSREPAAESRPSPGAMS